MGLVKNSTEKELLNLFMYILSNTLNHSATVLSGVRLGGGGGGGVLLLKKKLLVLNISQLELSAGTRT